jgi:Na+-transporting NADH:ubiquinone oxidoreductase subunit NqrF
MKDKNKATVNKTKAGRPKGFTTKGRMTRLENVGAENAIRLFINQKFAAAVQAWEEIDDPNQKVNTFIKLMEFVIPKRRSVDFKPEIDTENSLEARLSKMMKEHNAVNNNADEKSSL